MTDQEEDIFTFDGSILVKTDLNRIKSRLETARQLTATTQDPAVLASWYVQDIMCLARQAKYFSGQFDEVVKIMREQNKSVVK